MNNLAAFVRARLDEGGLPPRMIEALHAILARYEDCLARMEDDDYSAVTAREQAREYEDFVLPNLAAAWNDHPDWEP